MKDKKKVTINTIFYLLYQIILFVAPLVIMPYLTRVLSESSLGQHSFSYSIAYYFVLGANLGISTYGQREIAAIKKDRKALSVKFWSLFYVHSFTSIVSLISYIIFSVFNKQAALYLCIIPYVLSALFDVTWFFYGLENFRITTIINAIITVLKAALIFIFVRSDGDLWKYQLIAFGSMLMIQLIIFLFALKTVGAPKAVKFKDCLAHIKPIVYFALAAIALSLYTYIDKILLGIMVKDEKQSVAFYECADKIVAVPRMLIAVLGAVLYPRMVSLTEEKNNDEIGKFTIFSIDWTSFLAIGSMFGLIFLAVPFSIMYYGPSYKVSGYCMMLMSPLIVIICLSTLLRSQFILPQRKDKVYLTANIMNAGINLILNSLLIPLFGVYGVIIASIISESVALIYQLIYCRKMFPFGYAFKSFLIHLMSAFVMVSVLFFIQKIMTIDSWLILLINVAIGASAYVVTLLVLSKILHYQNFLVRLFRKRKN